MKFSLWEKWYETILKEFNFSKQDDEISAEILNDILNKRDFLTIEKLLNKIKSVKDTNNFIVFGAGPSLKNHIKLIKKNYNLNDYILISADGATTALLEENIIPDIIVTDLDGKIEDLLKSNKKGSFMVIHAHGNNSSEIVKYTKDFKNVLGTTQSKPLSNIYNFGGFTDGDRAIFLAISLNAQKIILAGMDFGNIVTKYSRPNLLNDTEIADDIKQKKLEYAQKLTKWICENEDVELINLK